MYENDRREITATEFKQSLGKYLDYVAHNHEVVITKNNQPVVRVEPYVNKSTKYIQLREEAVSYSDDNTLVSYEEFLEISERSEGRMEYINGEIIMQASPNVFHQEAVGNLHFIIKSFLRGKRCKVFLAPFDVTFYKERKNGDKIKIPDVIQPDLLIACDTEGNVDEKGRYSGIPTLVVELLSPSTRTRDMIEKCNSYMLGGCQEYWIVDVEQKMVMQYVFVNREVERYVVYGLGDVVRAASVVGLEVLVDEVFEELVK